MITDKKIEQLKNRKVAPVIHEEFLAVIERLEYEMKQRRVERECLLANEAELRRVDGIVGELKAEIEKLKTPQHLYDGPDCIYCGHYGPIDDPDEPCASNEKRIENSRRLYERLHGRQAMKPGDVFQHFKGGVYTIVGEGVRSELHRIDKHDGQRIGEAHDSEDPNIVITVYRESHSEVLLIFGHGPANQKVVIYESTENGEWWFRSLENFTEILPTGRPRFLKIGSPKLEPASPHKE